MPRRGTGICRRRALLNTCLTPILATVATKRGNAINGDLFILRHPSVDLNAPFTSFIDVAFRGTTHQAFVARDRSAFSFTNATGEFTVGDFAGHILEMLDSVETQVSHRYQAVVSTPHGVLSTHSYDSVPGLLALVGSLRPAASRLGVVLDPDDECEYTTAPRVALDLPGVGVLEVTPLTAEVIDQLPDWQGSQVAGGQLYGGRFTDNAAYLTLVTPTCRVLALPGAHTDEDHVAEMMASLEVDWQT